jgi:transposase-like protein
MESKSSLSKRYLLELMERAVRLVQEIGAKGPAGGAAVLRTVRQLGMGTGSLRQWVKLAGIGAGQVLGVSSEEAAEIRWLGWENAELRRAYEILQAAAAFLGGGARPPAAQVVVFTAAHQDNVAGGLRWGAGPVCHVLQVGPSTYYKACSGPPSARAVRDAQLGPELRVLWERNYPVYGRRGLWQAARRAGVEAGRDQVARLMRAGDMRGAGRAGKRRTAKPGPAAVRAPDLVRRDFTATAPDRTWVADFTYCPTWSGVVYVAFVIDVFSRRIVGWKAARPMSAPLVIDALNMAAWTRGHARLDGLVGPSDTGPQHMPVSCTRAAHPDRRRAFDRNRGGQLR